MSTVERAQFERKRSDEEVLDKIFTAPNVISFIRLLLVPVFIWLISTGHDISALVVFVIAAASDCVDGQVARRTHQVSKLGILLDPAIDTILMLTGVLSICFIGRVPAWFAVIIICREAFLLIGGGILLRTYKIRVPVIYAGKAATTFLFTGFAGMLLNLPQIPGLGICNISWLPGFNGEPVAVWIWLLYLGLIFQIGVTIYYCIKAYRALKTARATRASQ